jgi:hypothetical protein
MKVTNLIGLVSLGFVSQLMAEEAKTLADCMKIADDKARLVCFDKVSQNKVKAPEGFEIVELPKPSESKAYKDKIEQEKDNEKPTGFGKEHLKDTSESGTQTQITAMIKGPFSGWSGKTKFVLDNGQIWKQADKNSSFYVKLDNPTIIIEKGSLGTYFLSVSGYAKRVRVKRIK